MSVDWCNVLCRNLPSHFRNDDLFELFAPFGNVLSARVMWDHERNCSKRYGFVRFSRPEEATASIQSLHRKNVMGKVISCSTSKMHEVESEPPCDNLYIKYLPEDVDEEVLTQVFSAHGNVIQCCVMKDDDTNTSKRIGFVRFSSVEEAIAAKDALNGTSLCDSPFLIKIKFAETQQQKVDRKLRKSIEFSGAPFTYPPYGSDDSFYMPPQNETVDYVQIEQSYMTPMYVIPPIAALHPHTSWALVPIIHPSHPIYLSEPEAKPTKAHLPRVPSDDLVPKTHNTQISSKKKTTPEPSPIDVKTEMTQDQVHQNTKEISRNLFVLHLPQHIRQRELLDLFSPHGFIEKALVAIDKATGRSKGYGFVTYKDIESACLAVKTLNGQKIGHKILKVEFNPKI
eukprot:TRINITY_DN10521_c0_g1_i1.p1 TRINITY_DN10521_c0_g1~~TRINITY_DN10521_c0_g1_i1.p1  ORF type:complete len:398 (+),score=85.67 TRINITY_DN10521_c0_g1_i1:70-1263(+)